MIEPNRIFFAAFGALLGFYAMPASAVTAVFLSHTGSGASCLESTPCKSMANALTAAGPGGEVICLDKGYYGGVNITQSVSIFCGDGLWDNGLGSVAINTQAGAEVVIEGLVLDQWQEGGGTISFTGQGSLRLRRVRVGNSAIGAHGLTLAPTGGATVTVSDSVFSHNSGSGILVRPTGSGYANVHIRNTTFEGNANGLFADGSASSTGINVNISESTAVQNQGNGIGAYSSAGGAPVTVSIKDSHISGNVTNGLGALGAAASGAGSVIMDVGSTMINANVNGVSSGGGAQIRTHGNNHVQLNSNNGAFTSNVGLQ